MKMKKGFTLAEVLITLSIVGVVAAITLPSLLADTASAQIGPKLAKSVSMFEQANENLLNVNAVDSLTDSGFIETNCVSYLGELKKYLKGSTGTKTFTAKDGVTYTLSVTSTGPANTTDPPHMQRIGDITVDINGSDSKPNQAGTDLFYFSWWNDGSMRAKGARDWGGAGDWTTKCKNDGSVPADYTFCAGHIFENNYKVLYR